MYKVLRTPPSMALFGAEGRNRTEQVVGMKPRKKHGDIPLGQTVETVPTPPPHDLARDSSQLSHGSRPEARRAQGTPGRPLTVFASFLQR